jgi:phage repressor protein C with HTH and peptisase S24 domain
LDITDWINACKAELGIRSDREFSRYIGISSGLLSKWKKGECTPSTDSLKKIAKSTGMYPGTLLGLATGSELPLIASYSVISDEKDKAELVRIYTSDDLHSDTAFITDDCVAGSETDSNADFENDAEEAQYIVLPDRYGPPDEFFAFCVPDNNMAPELISGDTVIVHRQDTASDGDTVIVCIGEGSAVCAIYTEFEEGIILDSPTRVPGPAFFSNSSVIGLPVRIIGKVVDIFHREYR